MAGNKTVSPEPVAGVSLRPHDPLAKKVASTGISTRNVLIKVTTPKRTGRKRKRGSDDPFADHSSPEPAQNSITAPELLQRLRDNAATYQIEAVGCISDTHRFRGQPDFQLCANEMPIMHEIRDKVMVPSYDTLERFKINDKPGSEQVTAFPAPPRFAINDLPYQYEYQQAPGIEFGLQEDGTKTTHNIRERDKRRLIKIAADAESVPQELPPDPGVAKGKPPGAVKDLETFMITHPVATLRTILSICRTPSVSGLRDALPWVCYTFTSGPWLHVMVKFGVDPRGDPKYRFSQPIECRVDDNGSAPRNSNNRSAWSRRRRASDEDTHIFDGTKVDVTSHTWQIGDVTDPLLQNLIHTKDIRPECDVFRWGWYYSATLCKLKVIMTDKINHILKGMLPPDDDYKVVLTVPDKLTKDNQHQAKLSTEQYNHHVYKLGCQLRSMLKQGWNNAERRGYSLESGEGVEFGDGTEYLEEEIQRDVEAQDVEDLADLEDLEDLEDLIHEEDIGRALGGLEDLDAEAVEDE